MKGRWFNLLAGLLLLLWLACASTWAHSYFSYDYIRYVTRHSGHYFQVVLESVNGVVEISFQHQTPQSTIVYSGSDGWECGSRPRDGMDLPGSATRWHGVAVGYDSQFAYAMLFSGATPGFDDHLDHYDQTRSVWFPEWVPTLALTTAIFVVLQRIRRRHRSGMCPSCGYDLRATPDRCPECGTVSGKVAVKP